MGKHCQKTREHKKRMVNSQAWQYKMGLRHVSLDQLAMGVDCKLGIDPGSWKEACAT